MPLKSYSQREMSIFYTEERNIDNILQNPCRGFVVLQGNSEYKKIFTQHHSMISTGPGNFTGRPEGFLL